MFFLKKFSTGKGNYFMNTKHKYKYISLRNNEWLIQVDRNEMSLNNDNSIALAVRNVILLDAHFSHAHIHACIKVS